MTKTPRSNFRPACLLAAALCTSVAALGQQTGPPAYVPVPAAPMASDQPKREPDVAVSPTSVHFRVRLLDGRSSLPVENGRVRLWYDERDNAGYLLTTDAHGEALLPEPPSTPLRVLVMPDGLFDCRKLSERELMPGYNLQQIAGKGVVAENHCQSGSRAAPHRGELTLFARTPHWYEKLNQGVSQ